MKISDNVRALIDRVSEVAASCGRKAEDIQIVAASKYATAEQIREAHTAGIRIFGENRLRDAEEKIHALGDLGIEWYFIGRIQSNKIRRIFARFKMVQSVDSEQVLKKAQVVLDETREDQDVLLQVNISGESRKAGFTYEEIQRFLGSGATACYPRIHIRGLMSIGPMTEDERSIQASFERFRNYFESCRNTHPEMRILSMGMSHDFEHAIRMGSTMIRVGSYIFEEQLS